MGNRRDGGTFVASIVTIQFLKIPRYFYDHMPPEQTSDALTLTDIEGWAGVANHLGADRVVEVVVRVIETLEL